MDLCKQQEFYANAKAIQQINFTGNLTRFREARIYFIIDEVKETGLGFSKRTVKVLRFYFVLIKH